MSRKAALTDAVDRSTCGSRRTGVARCEQRECSHGKQGTATAIASRPTGRRLPVLLAESELTPLAGPQGRAFTPQLALGMALGLPLGRHRSGAREHWRCAVRRPGSKPTSSTAPKTRGVIGSSTASMTRSSRKCARCSTVGPLAIRPMRLVACRLADPAHQRRVEGRAERRRGREARGRHAPGDPDVVALVRLPAEPVRAVRQRDRRDAGARHRRRVPDVRAQAQRGLLLEGQCRGGNLRFVAVRRLAAEAAIG